MHLFPAFGHAVLLLCYCCIIYIPGQNLIILLIYFVHDLCVILPVFVQIPDATEQTQIQLNT